jgi:hypothetical protein
MRVFGSALLFVVPIPPIIEGFQFRIGAQLYTEEDQYDKYCREINVSLKSM